MFRLSGWPRWAAPLLFAVGLAALYWSALGTGFLNDDYLFLEQARTRPLAESLTHLDPLGNYWRPLSRQLYFAALGGPAGGDPRLFHAVNFAAFLGALALLADLLAAFVSGPALLAGLAFFALLPFQRVNLMWISCAQDLFALLLALAAVALWRRERRGAALAAYVAAIASKESALPLPLVLLAWDAWIAGRPPRAAARRQLPLAAAAIAWGAIELAIRARSTPQSKLEWRPDGVLAALAHLIQSLAGIEHPPGFLAAFVGHLPPLLPLALIAAAGLVAFSEAAGRGAGSSPAAIKGGGGDVVVAGDDPAPRPATGTSPTDGPRPWRFALAWIFAFTLATWPVVYMWSGYFYTLAAAGAALLVALAARRIDRIAWVALAAALLWWHAAGTSIRAFAVTNRPWGWTSHLTTWYFTRGARLASAMGRDLRRIEPSPAAGTRFFFATLPPWAGFQMGNGALIRTLYRDPSLESHFYSRFSDTTAAGWPCRFLYWDGAEIQPLYPGDSTSFFQVGCDLLLLDRPRGAAHAFRRSLAAGDAPWDGDYWLGWASLWQLDREGAEAAWERFGARDDSATFARRYAEVQPALYQRADTLAARRLLLEAIRAGIGQPNPHAILGELLLARGGIETKYGLLELKIAAWLNPRDLLARRELVAGLAAIHMDDQARAALESLQKLDLGWRSDSAMVRVERELEARQIRASDVASFDAAGVR